MPTTEAANWASSAPLTPAARWTSASTPSNAEARSREARRSARKTSTSSGQPRRSTLRRRADQGPDGVAPPEELGDDVPAEEAVGSGDEDLQSWYSSAVRSATRRLTSTTCRGVIGGSRPEPSAR